MRSVGEKKQTVRTLALRRRDSVAPTDLELWGHWIEQAALQFPPYLLSRSVALYSPIGSEVATEEIRDHALRSRKKLFYPKLASGGKGALVQVNSPSELKPGRFGILEPVGTKVMAEEDKEQLVVFVPGLAFDLRGNRLGRGKGWYDRTLALVGGRATLIAPAFEFQIVEAVPTDRWDQRVHYIITERRIIACGDGPSLTRPIP